MGPPYGRYPPSGWAGTERVVSELVDSWIDAGREPVLFGPSASRGGFRHSCPVRGPYPDPVAFGPAEERRVVEAAYSSFVLGQLSDVEVVHSHLPAFTLLAHAAGLEVPLVETLHWVSAPVPLPGVTYVAISHSQKASLGLPATTPVIHHGLSPERYPIGLDPDPDKAAFLGRLSPEKGAEIAVEAARRAGLRLEVGGGPRIEDREYFDARLAPRLAQPHVSYLGEITGLPKLRLLRSSSAVLCPVRWKEPFGLVLIEAMLSGTPVIAFGEGAIPEIIEEGVTGFIARDLDHMVELLRMVTGPNAGNFDRQRCRDRAIELFSAQRMADRYLELFQALA